jgi:hypothetical protein
MKTWLSGMSPGGLLSVAAGFGELDEACVELVDGDPGVDACD